MIYNFIRALIHGFLKMLFFLRIEGAENIPKGGGYLVCSNHTSNWDPLVVSVLIKDKISYMAKEELFRFAPFGLLIKYFGAIPVKRGGGGAVAVKSVVEVLKRGGIVTVFPEGTRAKRGERLRPKTGAVRIALKCSANILPVGISGVYRPFSRITIRIGNPIQFDKIQQEEQAAKLSEKLMDKIYDLAKE